MKKTRLMFLLSLFLTSIPLVAQTEDEAKLAAVKFLQQKKGVTLSNLSTVKVVTGKSAATRSADGTAGAAVKGGDVYAFNADDGGFAVVCTGNGNTAVAGYSEKGKVDVATMPEPMKEWLASYAAAMTNTKEILKQDPSYTAQQPFLWLRLSKPNGDRVRLLMASVHLMVSRPLWRVVYRWLWRKCLTITVLTIKEPDSCIMRIRRLRWNMTSIMPLHLTIGTICLIIMKRANIRRLRLML